MSKQCRKADVVIVGGGASGLAAAITLRMSSDLSVLVIEKLGEPARKIRATGSGRCNITNTTIPYYYKIMEFFARIGLVTRDHENGLVYPYSESAADVAELLITRTKQLGANIACGEEVVSVRKVGADQEDAAASEEDRLADAEGTSRFQVVTKYKDAEGEHEAVTEARYVILACGGKAGPMYGTTGDGYRLARALGHSIVTPVPVLTGVECAEWAADHSPRAISLAGTRTRGIVTLHKPDKNVTADAGAAETKDPKQTDELFVEEGEIQFTKYGLSGICVFNMTRHMRFDASKGESLADFLITADLFPGRDVTKMLRVRRDRAFKGERADEVLRTVLRESIADYVMRSVAAKDKSFEGKALRDISDEDIALIDYMVHSMEFHPVNLRGWKDAQATAGGVPISEIDEKTSVSKVVDGLYITGELMDKDYQCGGFNLSNAWISGIRAAEAIAATGK